MLNTSELREYLRQKRNRDAFARGLKNARAEYSAMFPLMTVMHCTLKGGTSAGPGWTRKGKGQNERKDRPCDSTK